MSDKSSSYPSHPIKQILSSRQPVMVLFKYLLVIVALVMGLLSLQLGLRSLLDPSVYQKDFIQEYLLSRAVLNSVDPYLPLPELAARFLGPLPNSVLQHPTPHPPAVAVLSLPLGLLSYQQAAVAWLVFEMACIVVAIYLLMRWFDQRPGLALTAFVAFVMLGWSPFWEELITGQLMTLLLLLLIGSWLLLRAGDDFWGGLLLGLSVALKLIAWPIIIFLVLRKRWWAVVTAGVAMVVANLAAAILMGIDRVVYFYRAVGSDVSALYHAYEDNFSLWTIGWRVFEGTGSPVVAGISAPPLMNAPNLARVVSVLVPVALLGIGLWLAVHAYSFDTSFGILICTSILVSPVAWRHYLVLALIPLAVVGRYLFTLDWPRRETNAGLLLVLLLFVSRTQLSRIILLLAGHESGAGPGAEVPFAIALLSFVPTVAMLGLIGLLWHLDRARPDAGSEAQAHRVSA